MTREAPIIRYETGEVARIGDRVDADGWPAVVEDVLASPADLARCGVREPGLLACDAAGLVFEPCSSVAWDAVVFEGRGFSQP